MTDSSQPTIHLAKLPIGVIIAANSTCSVGQKAKDGGILVPTVWDSPQRLGPQTLTDGPDPGRQPTICLVCHGLNDVESLLLLLKSKLSCKSLLILSGRV